MDIGIVIASTTPPPPRTCPERGLLVAVLEQALNDLRFERRIARQPRRGRRGIVPARAWLAATDPCWPFSFDNICDQLGLDGAAIRRAAGVVVR